MAFAVLPTPRSHLLVSKGGILNLAYRLTNEKGQYSSDLYFFMVSLKS